MRARALDDAQNQSLQDDGGILDLGLGRPTVTCPSDRGELLCPGDPTNVVAAEKLDRKELVEELTSCLEITCSNE